MNAPLVHLPIKTNFCAAEVPLWGDLSFFLDGNSKITVSNGTYDNPKPNAFSLPAASVSGPPHCPGSTIDCRSSCYVRGLAKHAPDLYAKYVRNADVLAAVLSGPSRTQTSDFARSADALAQWIHENARGGFRWHVSGDVQNDVHAHWIVEVCLRAFDVPFWIYTRTLDAVEILVRAPNLAVNVSADVDNYADAWLMARTTGARITYLTTDGKIPAGLPADSVIFPDYSLRGRDLADPMSHAWWQGLPAEHRKMVCPTDFFGQSEAARCGPCRKCLDK